MFLANFSPMVEKCLQNSLVIVAGSYLGTPFTFIAVMLLQLFGRLFSISCINFQSFRLSCLYSLHFSLK